VHGPQNGPPLTSGYLRRGPCRVRAGHEKNGQPTHPMTFGDKEKVE
jgi:hypothetical protein